MAKVISTVAKNQFGNTKIVENPVFFNLSEDSIYLLNNDLQTYERIVERLEANPIASENFNMFSLFTTAANVNINGNIGRFEIAIPSNYSPISIEERITNSQIQSGGLNESVNSPIVRYKKITTIYATSKAYTKFLNNDSKPIATQISNQLNADNSSLLVFFNKAAFDALGQGKTINPYIVDPDGNNVVATIDEIDLKFQDNQTRFKNNRLEFATNYIFLTKRNFNNWRKELNLVYGTASEMFSKIQLDEIPKKIESYQYRSSIIIPVTSDYLNEDIIIGAVRESSLTFSPIQSLQEYNSIREIRPDINNGGVTLYREGAQMIIEDPFTNMDDGNGNPDGIESEFIQIYSNGSTSILPSVANGSITNIVAIDETVADADDGEITFDALILESDGTAKVLLGIVEIGTSDILVNGVVSTGLNRTGLTPGSYTIQILDSNSQIVTSSEFTIAEGALVKKTTSNQVII